MMIASYRCPLLISRSTNLAQSSTIQRMGASLTPEEAAFSLPQATMPFAASTWQTCAPALAQATVAAPV